MDTANELKKRLTKTIKEHIVLKPLTAWQVGGVADFYIEARSINELISAAQAAVQTGVPYFVLGGGSQVIISDIGFPGLVIRNLTSTISFIPGYSQVIVDSGVITARLVMESAGRDLGGIEFLAATKGTLAGAVYANKGAFGKSLANFVKTLTVFEPLDGVKIFPGEWLNAGYAATRLKTVKEDGRPKPIILSIKLQLQHYKKEEIMRKVAFYQKLVGLPKQNKYILGPVFKNPSGEPSRPNDDDHMRARQAEAILRKMAANKLRVGKAQFFDLNPNYIVNRGGARADDFRQLIALAKRKAAEIQGVLLEPAVEFVGQWE